MLKQTYLLCCFFVIFLIFTSNGQSLVWSAKDQIRSSKLDNSEGRVILNGNLLKYMRLDKLNQKVYWTDSKSEALYSVNYDGSDPQTVIRDIYDPEGFCLMDGFIFIVVDRSIRKYDFDGNLIDIVIDQLDGPSDLEGDEGLLFWTDLVSGKIEKISVDGTGRDTIAEISSGPFEIEINSTENYLMYCTFTENINTGLYKIDFDGSNQERLSYSYFVNLSYDEESKDLYWLTEYGISRSPLIYPVIQSIIEPKPVNYPQFRVDAGRNILFMAPYYKERIIIKTPLDVNTEHETIIKNKLFSTYLISPDNTNSSIYYTSGNIDLNGISKAFISSVDLGTKIPQLQVGSQKLSNVVSAKYDIIHKKFYWFEKTNGKFYYSNTDGSNISEIFETKDDVHSFDVDPVNERIIWFDLKTSSFYSCDREGQNLKLISNNVPYAGALNFSPKNGNLFFIDYQSHTINLLDINTGIVSVITGDLPNQPISMTLDDTAGKIYFTKNNKENTLWSINYDGSELMSRTIDDLPSGSSLLIIYDRIELNTDEFYHDLVVYPSPFSNELFLSNCTNVSNVQLFDSNGQRLLNKAFNNQELIEFNNLEIVRGFYFLRIESNSGLIKTVKVVKI